MYMNILIYGYGHLTSSIWSGSPSEQIRTSAGFSNVVLFNVVLFNVVLSNVVLLYIIYTYNIHTYVYIYIPLIYMKNEIQNFFESSIELKTIFMI